MRAIEGTAQGQTHLDPNVAGKVLAQIVQTAAPNAPDSTASARLEEQLTGPEEEVLRLLVQGLSNPEIAQALQLAPGTVRNYMSDIFAKLGVSDWTQAAVMALKLGYGP